jgi:hypothetical protein
LKSSYGQGCLPYRLMMKPASSIAMGQPNWHVAI